MNRFEKTLHSLEESAMLRRIPSESSGLIDLVSNNYLGLASREEEFHEEFFSRYSDVLFSSSASRLLSRRQKHHNMLENELSQLYDKSVLLFNSGFHANEGILSALGSLETTFLVDNMMHASGRDGLMLAEFHRKADVRYFPHNDVAALEEMVSETQEKKPGKEIIIVSESIFSMDGDLSPLTELVRIRHKFPNVLLYIDEAHAFGVRGPRGLGLSEELDLIKEIDIIIGTFGKAAASMGAFVATSREIRDFLLNKARSFIFSTALPPVNMAWSHFMLTKIIDMNPEREHLKRLSRWFGNKISNRASVGDSQIIPLMCGSAEKAIATAGKIRSLGYDALPIRRPSVPPGGERIRLSLNATLTESDLIPLLQIKI